MPFPFLNGEESLFLSAGRRRREWRRREGKNRKRFFSSKRGWRRCAICAHKVVSNELLCTSLSACVSVGVGN